MYSCRQNYHKECEDLVNRQINVELNAHYAYLAITCECSRDDVALPGAAKYFQKMAEEESTHAQSFMKLQTMRGGKIVWSEIKPAALPKDFSLLNAFRMALDMEKKVKESLDELSRKAEAHRDIHLSNFLGEYIDEQIKSIYEMASHVTKLERVGEGLGVYQYDKDLESCSS